MTVQSAPEQGQLVRRILRALDQDPRVSGERLAQAMGISAGYLARSFKRETGVSLVEYRNRLRLARFFVSIERGGCNLLDAALEAGFGSYAQFHRVHRKLLGRMPKESLLRRHQPIRATRIEYPRGDAPHARSCPQTRLGTVETATRG